MLTRPRHLSCRIIPILDFVDCIPMVFCNMSLCAVYFLLMDRSGGLIRFGVPSPLPPSRHFIDGAEVKWLSSVQPFETPRIVAHQAPLSMGFSRQEYWSGLPFPSPGDLPNPGIEPGSTALRLRNVEKMLILSFFLRIPDPYLLFESPRPLAPLQGPWTSYQPT